MWHTHTHTSSRKSPYNRTLIAYRPWGETCGICERSREKNFTINFPARFRVYLTKWRYSLSSCSLRLLVDIHFSTLSLTLCRYSFSQSFFFLPFSTWLFRYWFGVLLKIYKNSTLLSVLLLEYKLFIVATWINEHLYLMNRVFVLVCCYCYLYYSSYFFLFFAFIYIIIIPICVSHNYFNRNYRINY